MLSTVKYSAFCVLGAEIFYLLCLPYGLFLWAKGKGLRATVFELIPGFVWGAPVNIAWSALFFGILGWIGGWYIAWMHNRSLLGS